MLILYILYSTCIECVILMQPAYNITHTYLAKSRSSCATASLPRADPLKAAWLMRLARSAPEKPGVPRATTSKSVSANGTSNKFHIRIQNKS